MSSQGHYIYQIDNEKEINKNLMNSQRLQQKEGGSGYIMDNALVSSQIQKFLDEFNYEQKIQQALSMNRLYIELEVAQLLNYSKELYYELKTKPNQFLDTFEMVLNEYALKCSKTTTQFQIILLTNENPISIRQLDSSLMGRLVCVAGLITSSSKIITKAKTVVAQCYNCAQNKRIVVNSGMGGLSLPSVCQRGSLATSAQNRCPMDPYRLIPYYSTYIDTQTFKLQEIPEDLPTGQIPRTFLLQAERTLVNKMKPGNRVNIIGIFQTINRGGKGTKLAGGNQMNSNNKTSYLRVVGYSTETTPLSRLIPHSTQQEHQRILQLSKRPDIHKLIERSIAPGIYGSDDIKRAIACQLFSGSTKTLPDGMRLRGDINILLLGDPSTAKSQFLKFVERAAPISVYTSGKGSSAAGLTASIIRDSSTGEFSLEGGAMVLADGGVVCIDQFDKMRSEDRVAIHEAMEQQTISIAKAGITTVLNSRCSVLAAANPLAGFYESLKAAAEQIDFQTTILSRFDCIFIVKDEKNEQKDKLVASHVLKQHKMGTRDQKSNINRDIIQIDLLRKYIATARKTVSPRLSKKAGEMLQNFYVTDRKETKSHSSKKDKSIPITVRQLQALIRISESFAKMQLENVVTEDHVLKAHQLFQTSTLSAAKGSTFNAAGGMDSGSGQEAALTKTIEEAVKRRIGTGNTLSWNKLTSEMVQRYGSSMAVSKAILVMVQRGQLQQLQGREILKRIK